MTNCGMQNVCSKKMKEIIGVYGVKSGLAEVSNENVEKIIPKIADVKIKHSVTFSITVKHALYNLENFRPEIRSAFELQLFNAWHNAFKSLDVDQEEGIEPEIFPSVAEEASEVEEIVEEPAVMEEPESEVEEIVEEPVVMEEPESEVEEIVEEPVVMEEPGSEVEEIVEEPVSVQITELMEKEPDLKLFEQDEQQLVEKEPESLSQSLDQADEAEVFPKRHKRDWFDILLDFSAALMRFFMRILFKKRS
jgi:hypothetical protein